MRVASALCCLLVVAGCTGAPLGGDPAGGDGDVSTPADGTLEVHFINVGQSVSMLVVGPTGETLLADTGDYEDEGEYVIDYLRDRGIDRIDYLVTSHADADHVGGHAAVIDYFETEADGVGAVYDPGIAASTRTYEEYLDAVERHDVTLYRTVAGDDIPLAGADLRVLGPPEEPLASGKRNENSIVFRVAYGDTAFLFTGDAEEREEEYLVDRYGDDLGSTVLAAGHHGSATSTHDTLLDAVEPQAVVVSSAYDSQYGHPHEEVLDRLAARSITTYWTATHGDVVFVSDGRTATVRTQRAAPTDPRSLRDGASIAPGADEPLKPRESFDGDAGSLPEGTATADAAPRTATATDGGTAAPPDALTVATVNADATGDDQQNLNDEYVVFENAGDEPLNLSGWTVSDAAGKRYTFSERTFLAPGETLTLHTGSGTDRGGDLHWNASGPVWNNDGDVVTVETANGTEVVTYRYD